MEINKFRILKLKIQIWLSWYCVFHLGFCSNNDKLKDNQSHKSSFFSYVDIQIISNPCMFSLFFPTPFPWRGWSLPNWPSDSTCHIWMRYCRPRGWDGWNLLSLQSFTQSNTVPLGLKLGPSSTRWAHCPVKILPQHWLLIKSANSYWRPLWSVGNTPVSCNFSKSS